MLALPALDAVADYLPNSPYHLQLLQCKCHYHTRNECEFLSLETCNSRNNWFSQRYCYQDINHSPTTLHVRSCLNLVQSTRNTRGNKTCLRNKYMIQAVGISRTCFAQRDPRFRSSLDVFVENFSPSLLHPTISSSTSIFILLFQHQEENHFEYIRPRSEIANLLWSSIWIRSSPQNLLPLTASNPVIWTWETRFSELYLQFGFWDQQWIIGANDLLH